MKKKIKKLLDNPYIFVSFVVFILFLIFFIPSLFFNIYFNPSNPDVWCERFKPEFNYSGNFDEVNYCFTTGWSKYCKISYPDNCPK